MHFVLVGLYSDAGKGRVRPDGVGLAEIAVARGEAILEKLEKVNLAAGLGQSVKIFVVDMDIAVLVGLGDVRRDDILVEVVLGGLGAEFQHRAHGRVRVDVRVLTFHVHVLGRREGQVGEDVGQGIPHFAHLGVLGPVQDISLSGAGIAGLAERALDDVLHVLHVGDGVLLFEFLHDALGQEVHVVVRHGLVRDADVGLHDCVANLSRIKGDERAVPFLDLVHVKSFPFVEFLRSYYSIFSSFWPGDYSFCTKMQSAVRKLSEFSTVISYVLRYRLFPYDLSVTLTFCTQSVTSSDIQSRAFASS